MKPILNSAYLCVHNMDRAIAFWEKFLEQKVTVRDPLFSKFDLGTFRLCLFNPKKVKETVTYGDNCLLSFQVEDMEELKTKLQSLGAKIVYPQTKIGENWIMEFRDSEDNDVEIYAQIKG